MCVYACVLHLLKLMALNKTVVLVLAYFFIHLLFGKFLILMVGSLFLSR